MAQLRDSQTSAFVAEGTPLEMATLASKVGFDKVIFDDVGVDFDPQTVLDAHVELIDNIPDDASDEYVAGVAEMDKLPPDAVSEANAAIQSAHEAVENAQV